MLQTSSWSKWKRKLSLFAKRTLYNVIGGTFDHKSFKPKQDPPDHDKEYKSLLSSLFLDAVLDPSDPVIFDTIFNRFFADFGSNLAPKTAPKSFHESNQKLPNKLTTQEPKKCISYRQGQCSRAFGHIK